MWGWREGKRWDKTGVIKRTLWDQGEKMVWAKGNDLKTDWDGMEIQEAIRRWALLKLMAIATGRRCLFVTVSLTCAWWMHIDIVYIRGERAQKHMALVIIRFYTVMGHAVVSGDLCGICVMVCVICRIYVTNMFQKCICKELKPDFLNLYFDAMILLTFKIGL